MSKFKIYINYISTPFSKEVSLKYEPAMCRTYLIHGLAHRSLRLRIALKFAGAYEDKLNRIDLFIRRALSSVIPLN